MKNFLYAIYFICLIAFLSISSLIIYYQQTLLYPKRKEFSAKHSYWLNKLLSCYISIKYYKNKSYIIAKATNNSLKSKRFQFLRKDLFLRKIKPQPLNSNIVILLHGKNSRKEELLPLIERFIIMGFIVIAPDLPFHGNNYSNKKLLFNKNFLDSILDDAKKHINLNKKIAIWGFSLGGAYALINSKFSRYKFSSIVLVSTFDNINNIIKDKANLIFGKKVGEYISFIVINFIKKLNNLENNYFNLNPYAKNIIIPTLIIHGKYDNIINYKRGFNLYNHISSKKKRFILDNSNHYNILDKSYLIYKSANFILQHSYQKTQSQIVPCKYGCKK